MDIPTLNWTERNAFGYPQRATFSGYENAELTFDFEEVHPGLARVTVNLPALGTMVWDYLEVTGPDAGLQAGIWGQLCRALWNQSFEGRTLPAGFKTSIDGDASAYMELEAARAAASEPSLAAAICAEFSTPNVMLSLHRLEYELYESPEGALRSETLDLLKSGRLESLFQVRSRLDPNHVLGLFESSAEVPAVIMEEVHYDSEAEGFTVLPRDLVLLLRRGPAWSPRG